MGYTHYIRQPSAFTTDQWEKFCDAVRKILAEAPCPLAGWDGAKGTTPTITEAFISFNGVDDDSHETCRINRDGSVFSFCKTAYKP